MGTTVIVKSITYTSKKKPVVHLHNGILHSTKKEGAPTLRDNMDGIGEHYAK